MGASQVKGSKVMVDGTEAIHTVIRRSIHTVATLEDSRVSAANWNHLMDYVDVLEATIDSHHHHEEDIVFPAVDAKRANFMQQQYEEHQRLLALLERLKQFTSTHRVDPAANQETKSDPETLAQHLGELRAIATEIEELLDAHLRTEEDKLTAEFWDTEFQNKEVLSLHDRILSSVRRHPTHHTVFFCYHLEASQRELLGMPWFVRRLLFPRWAAAKANLWQFATHTTTDNGRFVF